MLFTQDLMKNDDKIKSIEKPRDRFKAIKERWNVLDPIENARYQKMAEEEKLKVSREIMAYETLEEKEGLQDREDEDQLD